MVAMDRMIDLMNLLEMSRAQPQYGYAIAGGGNRLGNLAEHHYLVTMIAWQLAALANEKGGNVNVEKVLKFCLLHDVGELFGGDISIYYAKANPEAKKLAKAFEAENQKYLSKFFNDSKEMAALSKEILDSLSDEAHIAKLADYMEVSHYKLFTNALHTKDIEIVLPVLRGKAEKIKDEKARKALSEFVEAWATKMGTYNSFLDASTSALEV